MLITIAATLGGCRKSAPKQAADGTQIVPLQASAEEGSPMFDMQIPDINRNNVSLMSLIQKNKITIVDFWASWCGPCMQEMPNMVALYNQYKDKGLGIVGISLDTDHNAWKEAIRQQGMEWPQLSELRQWEDNAAATAANVKAIPLTIVVDQSGKILKRNLRGEELAAFIKPLL